MNINKRLTTSADHDSEQLADNKSLFSSSSFNSSGTSDSRSASLWTLISKTRIEPLCFIAVFGGVTRLLSYQQLVQDKICIQEFHQSLDFCQELSAASDSPEKNAILARVSTFMLQKELISLIPNILMSLLVGSWCDRFPSAMRYSLFVAVIAQGIESIVLAFNAYYFEWSIWYLLFTALITNCLSGNGTFIVALGYISTNFPQEQRAFRFLSLDIFVNGAMAVGFYAGGIILSANWSFISTPLHNYADVFVIGAACYAFLLFWIYFLIPAQDPSFFIPVGDDVDINGNIQGGASGSFENREDEEAKMCCLGSCLTRFGEIFSFGQLKGAWKSVFKKRPLNFHKTLWWLLLYLNMVTLPTLGTVYIYYPLVEKLYQWDYVAYSRVQTGTQVMKPLAVLIIIPIIYKVFKPRDLPLSMVGCLSGILGGLALASITKPMGYYIFMVVSCIQGISAVGVRAFFTQFIPRNEISTLWSILMTFEIAQPFIGSVVYSNLFSLTIDYYPTFAFHFTSFLLIIALIILCKIDLHWGDISKLPRRNSIIVGYNADEQGFGGSRKPINEEEYDIIEEPR